jgi:hypothetical protein
MPGGATEPVAPVQIFDEKALELLGGFFYFGRCAQSGSDHLSNPRCKIGIREKT